MKICLINPPRLMKPMSATMKPSPSLGLAFIAGALKADGHEVSVVDALAEAPQQYIAFRDDIVINGLSEKGVAALVPADTEIIGLSLMFSGNWLHNRVLINHLRAVFPKAVIMAGGEHLTACPEFCITETAGLDVCVLGEGEETVKELVRVIAQGGDLSAVEGIVYRSASGTPLRTAPRKRIREVEEIARPAWEYFPLDKYKENSIIYGVDRGVYSLPLMATRGCPYECTFCSSPQMWGTRYFMRTPQDVVDEIEYFKNTFGALNFDFYDLTAIIRKKWIIDFAREVIARDLNITWQIPAGTRSEAIDQEVAHYLYKSGCRNITYAPESGSEHILKAIKKKVNLGAMLESIRYSSKEKMNIKINVIIGFPDDTHRDIWRTMLFLIKASRAGVNDMAPSVFSPYPGSELFERLSQEGKIDMTNDDYFFQIIYVDTFFNNYFYNGNVNMYTLRLYLIAYLAVFYLSNYIFHPSRLFATLRNLLTSRYESRAEMALGELIKRSKIKVITEEEETANRLTTA